MQTKNNKLKTKFANLKQNGCIGKDVVYDTLHNKLVKLKRDMCVGTDVVYGRMHTESVKRDACVGTVHTPINYVVVGTVFVIVLCILVEYA